MKRLEEQSILESNCHLNLLVNQIIMLNKTLSTTNFSYVKLNLKKLSRSIKQNIGKEFKKSDLKWGI